MLAIKVDGDGCHKMKNYSEFKRSSEDRNCWRFMARLLSV